ncbi:tRNA uridine(34) 5-carboxymethylaminomethyl modification radical SAM/GNAT enzyme Elp3 [Patescibacteria group bacterium]|nr:tRNA uridine(34) 5-carboxymethylaminomethyl modification radical SAM/GNAT enzyme Elp3 [Patescibacteria group bacterium]
MNTENCEQLIAQLIDLKIKTADQLNKKKRAFCNAQKSGMPTNAELLGLYRKMIKLKQIAPNIEMEKMLQKRKIRTMSGVAPVAVLTKPFPCPGKCAFCPTEKQMPKSYLSNEPAVMRAIMLKFDPFKQVSARIKALEANGHATDKIELIVMGGTWSYFPRQYQSWFIKRCFDACNGKTSKNISCAHELNEKAKHRIVALTLETRPDFCDEKEIQYWRKLGATKVELGVQAIDDKILELNKRGHGVKEIISATKLFRQAGFKICYHIMPGLPGSTPAKDLKLFKQMFSDENFQPDFIKIYPTVVTKGTAIYKSWKSGKYKPYSEKQLFNLLLKMKLATPDRVRIIRLIRDIPQESISAGNKITNLRESLQKKLIEMKTPCQCIRCREAREDIKDLKQAKLFIEKFKANSATEYFLQYASPDKRKLYAFLRLRLPEKNEQNFIPEINGCAMIREIHTYGKLVPLAGKQTGIQHSGFGTKLTEKAEELARAAGFEKMAVISGVGVRGYYKKLGYGQEGTYMTKKL